MNYIARQMSQSSNKYLSKQAPGVNQSEQGATLIIVLMVVLVLAIIGTIAVRNSQVSLDMTTAAQVNQLLMQSSDVPIAKLELSGTESGENSMTQLQNMAKGDIDPIGLLSTEGLKESEYIFCYRPVATPYIYTRGKHRVVLNATGNKTRGLAGGYCKIKDSTESDNYFTSARQTVASQISLTRPTVNDSIADDVEVIPLSTLNEGIDGDSINKSEAIYLRAHVTSITPTLAKGTTITKIDDCLKLPIGGLAGESVNNNQNRCLGATDTPINIQVQDFAYNLITQSNKPQ